MKTQKYSKQREAIKVYLEGRKDHPTADMVYASIKEVFPNISLGTIYRNLALLHEIGEIQKISCGDNPDRFDWNADPHFHFYCTCCHEVSDIEGTALHDIYTIAGKAFQGEIRGHNLYFYGTCGNCLEVKREV